jgi:hypothetical protein
LEYRFFIFLTCILFLPFLSEALSLSFSPFSNKNQSPTQTCYLFFPRLSSSSSNFQIWISKVALMDTLLRHFPAIQSSLRCRELGMCAENWPWCCFSSTGWVFLFGCWICGQFQLFHIKVDLQKKKQKLCVLRVVNYFLRCIACSLPSFHFICTILCCQSSSNIKIVLFHIASVAQVYPFYSK